MSKVPEKKCDFSPLESNSPILLSGLYRSGTTFLTAVINRIPNIFATSSTVKYLRFCLPHFSDLDKEEHVKQLLEQTQKRLLKRWDIHLDSHKVLKKIQANKQFSHAFIYNAIMCELLCDYKPNASRWAEKIAVQWRDIPTFLSLFPNGKVIHIFRDPRDVVSSYKKMTYELWPTFLDACLNHKAATIDIQNFVNEFGEDKIMVLKAEDLASNLSTVMEQICVFLDEPFDEKMGDITTFEDIRGEDWRTNTSYNQRENNFMEAKSRWHDTLTPEELFLVEMICQPDMQNMGYVGSNQDLINLDFEYLGKLISDPWLAPRIQKYLHMGKPFQGYRTDPYHTEMKIISD